MLGHRYVSVSGTQYNSRLTLSKGGKMMECEEYSGKLMCSAVAFSV